MSQNYAKPLPVDARNNVMDEYPAPYKAVATVSTVPVASSCISLTDRTTVVEIAAVGGAGSFIRWVPRTETAAVSPAASVIASGLGVANFDHFIPAGTVRRFVVPIEIVPATSIMGANGANGLYNRLAWINASGVSSSVLSTEF